MAVRSEVGAGGSMGKLQVGLEDFEAVIAKHDAETGRRDPALCRDYAAQRRASHGALATHRSGNVARLA
jgi:hypothetical protein